MRPSSRPQPDRGCSPQIARPATARKATTRRNPRGCTLSRTSLATYPLAFAWRKTRLLPLFVWHADGNALDDLGMLVEHLFDLPRIDLEAARVDDLLLAVDDVEVAVVVHASDVARV